MMKRWLYTATAIVAAVMISGCGGSGAYEEGYNDGFYDGARQPDGAMVTLFLRDADGFSYGGVPYQCISPSGDATPSYVTAPNGEFSFFPGERCTFDLFGFEGTPMEPIFIEDDRGEGKGDIFYECDGGDGGTTDIDGSFEYLYNDICTFSF